MDTPAPLTIYNIIGGKHLDRLDAFLGIYADLFPQYTHYFPVIRQRATSPANIDARFVEHQWLIEIENQPAALATFKYAPQRHCGLALALAIKPEFRGTMIEGQRLSGLLNRLQVEHIQQDALVAGQPRPIGLVTEVESPKLLTQWQKYDYVELPVTYFEPPFVWKHKTMIDAAILETIGFHQMYLGVFPAAHVTRMDLLKPNILVQVVYAFLVDHYGLPEEHWAVHRALDSIAAYKAQNEI